MNFNANKKIAAIALISLLALISTVFIDDGTVEGYNLMDSIHVFSVFFSLIGIPMVIFTSNEN